MQDLSSMVPGLVPTSMSSGGEVHSNAAAMALPGSTPVSAPAPGTGQAPETIPLPELGAPLPVGTERERIHNPQQPPRQPPDPPGQFGGVTVGTGTDKPGHGWTLTPSAGSRVS